MRRKQYNDPSVANQGSVLGRAKNNNTKKKKLKEATSGNACVSLMFNIWYDVN